MWAQLSALPERGNGMYRQRSLIRIALDSMVASPAVPTCAQKKAKHEEKVKALSLPAEIWQDPQDVAHRNLIYGAGGEKDAPDPNGSDKVIKEDLEQTSPKFAVEGDKRGEGGVKLDKDPQAETAATRLLWAAGYFVDEDYYLPQIKIEGLPKLHRGRQFVMEANIVPRV